MTSPIVFVVGLKIGSPANGPQGMTRGGRFARSNERKRQREAIALAYRGFVRGAVSLPAVVRMTRIAPRALDDDNLAYAFKSCRDSLAACIGLRSDRDPRVVWQCAQRRGKPNEYGVEIAIEVHS
jgi:hypothetical protein